MNEINKTTRTELSRAKQRSSYDKKTVYDIIDEAMVCQVGFVRDGHPVVLPMAYGRLNDNIYLHGAKESPFLQDIINAETICISIFLLDGLVLARSAYSHSMNYRSAVIYGKAKELHSEEDKIIGLKALTDSLLKNRWESVRQPTKAEMKQTAVVAVSLDESSAKIRTGPPKDTTADRDFPVWAGVLPLEIVAGTPVTDENCVVKPDTSLMDYNRLDYTG